MNNYLPSLLIHNVFKNINEITIRRVFDELSIGKISHISFHENNTITNNIHVNFYEWDSSKYAQHIYNQLISGKIIKIIYNNNLFWEASIGKNLLSYAIPEPVFGQIRIQDDEEESMKHNSITIAPNITDAAFLNGRKGMGGKKIKHRIVLVRHGESLANIELMKGENIDSYNLDPKLSNVGINQGIEVANFLETLGWKPDYVIASQLSRAYNTAMPTINYLNNVGHNFTLQINQDWVEYNHKINQLVKGIPEQNISDWEYAFESKTKFIERCKNNFNHLKKIGSIDAPIQTIVFTHSQLISAILEYGLKEETIYNHLNTNTYYHLTNASITCLDITEDDDIHIQAFNYTKHLHTITGHHSPFI